jgi:hypothetical protein
MPLVMFNTERQRWEINCRWTDRHLLYIGKVVVVGVVLFGTMIFLGIVSAIGLYGVMRYVQRKSRT